MKHRVINRASLTCILLIFAADTFALTSLAQDDVKLTDAYQLLMMRSAEVTSELRILKASVTARHSDRIQKQDEFDSLSEEMDRLERTGKPLEKLNPSYGRLLLKKALVAAELKSLKRSLRPSHPSVIAKQVELAALASEAEHITK
jgi:hypothetical protein